MDIFVIRRSGGLGDIICCEPVIRGLRKKYPHAEILFGMPREFTCLFEGRSEATFKGYQSAEFTVHWMRRYLEMHDVVIDLRGPESNDERNGSPECSRTESFCNFAGVSASCPEIQLTEDEKKIALEEIGSFPKPWIGIGPNGTNWTRNWPEDRWAELIEKTPGTKFYFDLKTESPFEDVVPFVGKSLREIAGIISQLDLMMTVDTGLLHLAGALKIKTFSFWGPSDPKRTLKHYSNAYYLDPAPYREKAGCNKPCMYAPDNCTDVNGRISKCMDALGAEEVIESVNGLLAGPAQRSTIEQDRSEQDMPEADTVKRIPAKAQEYETRVSLSQKGEKTRIVWIGKHLLPTIGGAERSAVEMIKHLSDEGYEVMAFWSHHQSGAFNNYCIEMTDGILWAQTPPGILLLKMLEADPDIVITQLAAAAAVPKALPKRTPLFLMLRSATDHFCPNATAGMECMDGTTVDLENCSKDCISVPDLNKPYRLMKNVYGCADEVFANSESMRRAFKHFTGRDCLVQYPVPKRHDLEGIDTTKEFCVAIRPDIGRGLEFLRELAEHMPEEKFLFVDSHQERLQNITVTEKTENLRAVFDRALVVLCPHIAYEAFGRVPAEAGTAGIPSITSPVGGLPESVGKGGYVEPLEIDRWAKRIRSLRSSESTWNSKSRAAIRHSDSFDWSVMLDKIKEYEAKGKCES